VVYVIRRKYLGSKDRLEHGVLRTIVRHGRVQQLESSYLKPREVLISEKDESRWDEQE
jgi:hypothetical protein